MDEDVTGDGGQTVIVDLLHRFGSWTGSCCVAVFFLGVLQLLLGFFLLCS